MRVLVLVKATTSSEAGEMPSTDLLGAMGEFNQQLHNAGVLIAGEGLKPSRFGIRVTAQRVVSGPFMPANELVAGFWIWEVANLDEAIAWAKRCPTTMPDQESVLEIRPLMTAEDFGEAMTSQLQASEQQLRDQLKNKSE